MKKNHVKDKKDKKDKKEKKDKKDKKDEANSDEDGDAKDSGSSGAIPVQLAQDTSHLNQCRLSKVKSCGLHYMLVSMSLNSMTEDL